MTELICINCGKPGNQATRIGIFCPDCLVHFEDCCDFCSDPIPTWIYPAQEFLFAQVIDLDHGDTQEHVSAADWLACDTCHNLIEAERWDDLANRGLDTWLDTPEDRDVIGGFLLAYHQKFNHARQGPAIRRGSA